MAEIKQVRLGGFGGQGIVLAGTVLGYAAIYEGKWVAGSSSYGAAARGGNCYYDMVISNQPIIFPHVIRADVLAVMSQGAYDECLSLVEHGIVIYDKRLVSIHEVDALRQVAIPATDLAIDELGNKQVANMIMLGALAGITKLVSKNALISAIEQSVAKRFKELNVKAAELGFRLSAEE
jgi:2-oxoglutarate ferredoxin oxidoreductase subunit gamma